MFQIHVTQADKFGSPIKDVFQTHAVLYSLLREEIIFCDENCECFSRIKSEEMLSYSDFFNKRFGYGQYKCLKNG